MKERARRNIRFNAETLEKLDAIAESQHRSRTGQVEFWCCQEIDDPATHTEQIKCPALDYDGTQSVNLGFAKDTLDKINTYICGSGKTLQCFVGYVVEGRV